MESVSLGTGVREARAVVLNLGERGCLPRVSITHSLCLNLISLVDAERISEGVLVTVGSSKLLIKRSLLLNTQLGGWFGG